MFVHPDFRGQGIASRILTELELWIAELDSRYCILETGINQKEAISLYEKAGYLKIDNYGQYAGVKTSYCYQKIIDLSK